MWYRPKVLRRDRCSLVTAAPIASPAGLSSRWPCATLHRITAPIYCRTRRAVWRFSFQIGSSTAITSRVSILSMRLPPKPREGVATKARFPNLSCPPAVLPCLGIERDNICARLLECWDGRLALVRERVDAPLGHALVLECLFPSLRESEPRPRAKPQFVPLAVVLNPLQPLPRAGRRDAEKQPVLVVVLAGRCILHKGGAQPIRATARSRVSGGHRLCPMSCPTHDIGLPRTAINRQGLILLLTQCLKWNLANDGELRETLNR